MPDAVAVTEEVVAPVDQKYDVPPEADRVTEPPSQNWVGPEGVINATGSGKTVTAWESSLEQPLALVTVTL